MRTRIIIVAITVLVLGCLLAWQQHRLKLVASCVDNGGFWNGPKSACEPDRGRIRIQRELQRS